MCSDYDFRQPLSIDHAHSTRHCEWCGKPAVYQLTAMGGVHHNEEGFFCQACSEEFVRVVADSLDREITTEVPLSSAV
jgi:hypothetical protein